MRSVTVLLAIGLCGTLLLPALAGAADAPTPPAAGGDDSGVKFDPGDWGDEGDKGAKPESDPQAAASADANKAKDDASGSESAPTTKKKPAADDPAEQRKKVETLLTYLERQYEQKMDSKDWVSRALATLSLNRSPRPNATKRVLEVMEKDKNPVVKLIAWQAVLSRASDLDAEQHKRWLEASIPMAEKGSFKGPLRAQLLELLATAEATPKGKRIYGALFDTCNAWEPQDIATLDALGACLATWRSPAVAEALIKRMSDPDACVRAEYVLRMAGADAPPAREVVGKVWDPPMEKPRTHPSSTELWSRVQAGYVNWLKGVREEWKKAKIEGEPWRELKPKYVPAPVPLDQIDPTDTFWTQDLELGRVNLAEFEVMFVVDATGSMGSVIEWLKRDLGKMMAAIASVSTAPKLGITFYRDAGTGFVTKPIPLTNQVQQLMKSMQPVTADGGGDIPEAVLAGLDAAIKQGKWSGPAKPKPKAKGEPAGAGTRVVVLIGDAPPHEKDMKKILELIKGWGGMGFRFHAVKVKSDLANNDLSTFDLIAGAGRGESVEATFPPLAQTRFLDMAGKPIDLRTIDRPEAQLVVAPRPTAEHPGQAVLATVLANAMNPQYKDRSLPLVQTLLAYCEHRPEPEKRKPFPANTPGLPPGMLKPQ